MTTEALPACRHRGEPTAPDVYRCHSPKLVGLKQVSADVCRDCYCRDHEPVPAPPAPAHLLPCAYLGRELDHAPG